MRGRIVALIAVALAAGCSLITPLDELLGDGGAVDATLDGEAPDVTTTNDAGVDAADVSVIDASNTCPSSDASVTFCDDFDDTDSSFFTRWSKVVANAGGAVIRVASDASAPFCVEFTLPAADGGPQSELGRTFASQPVTHMTYAFDVRVVRYPDGGLPFNLSPVELGGSAAAGATDFLGLKSSGAVFTEQFPIDSGNGFQTFPHTLIGGITSGHWISVSIDWTLGDGGMVVKIAFDGSDVIAPTLLDPRSVFGVPLILAGVSFEDLNADGVQVDIDNVVVTFE